MSIDTSSPSALRDTTSSEPLPSNEKLFEENESMRETSSSERSSLPRDDQQQTQPETSRSNKRKMTDACKDNIDLDKAMEVSNYTYDSYDTFGKHITAELRKYDLLEDIRPFPKAGPRLENKRNIRKRKSTIYTDTPGNENLIQLKTNRQSSNTPIKKTKKPKITGEKSTGARKDRKGKALREANKEESDDYESDEDDSFCLKCTESYSSSLGEDFRRRMGSMYWVQVVGTHKCVNRKILFNECKNCTSDLELFG